MASTGAKFPSLGTSVSETGHTGITWTTPTNIYADDGSTASVTSTQFDTGTTTYVLKATGFDFSAIPASATILGVTCRINAWYANGTGNIDLIQLLDVSRAKTGTNQAATPVTLTTNNATIITKGGAADKWGNALTVAWVQDPDFGVAIGGISTGANTDIFVDYVTLEIEYVINASVSATVVSSATTIPVPPEINVVHATVTPSAVASTAAVPAPPAVVGMIDKANTCEGTNGVQVTTGNSGGPDQFNNLTNVARYDSTRSRSGSTSIKLIGSGSSTWVGWAINPTSRLFARCYQYWTARPAASSSIIYTPSAKIFDLRIETDGRLRVYSLTGGTLGTTTAAVPLDAWCRIEFDVTNVHGVAGAETADIEVRLYSGANLELLTPDTGGTLTLSNKSIGGYPQYVLFHNPSSVDYWVDDVAASTTASPGVAPLNAAATPAAVVGTTSIPTATVQCGSTINAARVSGTTYIPTPSLPLLRTWQNSFEGGTSGQQITVGNSGGDSGDAFSSTNVYEGSLAYQSMGDGIVATAEVNGNLPRGEYGWATATYTVSLPNDVWCAVRAYIWLDSVPTQTRVQILSGTGWTLVYNPVSATYDLACNSGVIWSSPGTSEGEWLRFEVRWNPRTSTTGQIRLAIYSGSSLTPIPDYEFSSDTANLGTSGVNAAVFGLTNDTGDETGEYALVYYDDVAFRTVADDFIGPSPFGASITSTTVEGTTSIPTPTVYSDVTITSTVVDGAAAIPTPLVVVPGGSLVNQAVGTGTAQNQTIEATATVGNLLLLFFGRSGGLATGAITGITDTGNNSWSRVDRGAVSGVTNSRIELWQCKVDASPGTITVASATSQTNAWNLTEWSGVSTVTASNTDASSPDNSNSGASSTTITTPSITTVSNNDLLVAAARWGLTSGALQSGSPFTALTDSDDAGGSTRAAYLRGATAGNSYSCTWSPLGVAKQAGVLIAALKPAGGEGATVSAGVVSATASVGTATVTSSATAQPPVVAASASVSLPTITSSAAISAETVAASTLVALPQPHGGVSTSPALAAVSTSFGTPTITSAASVSASTVNGGLTITTPTVAASSNASAAAPAVSVSASVGTASVATGETTAAATVGATSTVGAPTISVGQTVTAGAVTAATSFPAETITSSASATAASALASTSIASPAISSAATVSPASVSSSAAFPAETITSSAAASGLTVNGNTSILLPSVAAEQAATATPVVASVAAVVDAVTVSATSNASTAPASADALVTVAQPAVVAGVSVQAAPAAVTATTAVDAASVAVGATAAASSVSGVLAVAQPTVGTGETVPAALVVGTTAIETPTVAGTASAEAAPSTVGVASEISAPEVAAGASAQVAPASVTAQTAVGTPELSTGQQAAAATVQAGMTAPVPQLSSSAAVSAPTVQASATAAEPSPWTATYVSAASVQVAASAGAPAISSAAAVSPASVSAVTGVEAAQISSSAAVIVTVVQPHAVVEQPTASGGALAGASTASVSTAIPTPAISASGNVTVVPVVVVASTSIGSASVSVGSTVATTTVAAAASTPQPQPHASVGVQPASVTASATVGTAVVTTGSSTTPPVVAAAVQISAPAVAITASATVTAETVQVSASAATPSVGTYTSSTATPAVVTLSTSVGEAQPSGSATVSAAEVSAIVVIAHPSASGSASVMAATVSTTASVTGPAFSSSAVASPARVLVPIEIEIPLGGASSVISATGLVLVVTMGAAKAWTWTPPIKGDTVLRVIGGVTPVSYGVSGTKGELALHSHTGTLPIPKT